MCFNFVLFDNHVLECNLVKALFLKADTGAGHVQQTVLLMKSSTIFLIINLRAFWGTVIFTFLDCSLLGTVDKGFGFGCLGIRCSRNQLNISSLNKYNVNEYLYHKF